MSEHTNCLNCDSPLQGKYCANCGQSADTHRLTLKHFFYHDFLHGVWHLDKGILFTLKQIFTRPGYAAIDYIKGKRKNYYNVFYLLLLLLGLIYLIHHKVEELQHLNTAADAVQPTDIENERKAILNITGTNAKYIIMSFIPLISINAYFLFKKIKYNYFEHIIIAAFVLLGCVCIEVVNTLLGLVPNFKMAYPVLYYVHFAISVLTTLCFLLFPAWAYSQVGNNHYKKGALAWRIVLLYFLFILELILITIIVVSLFRGIGGFDKIEMR